MNKYEAAYNLLMILSIADGDFKRPEGEVIIDYLRHVHEPYEGTENENKALNELEDDKLIRHFEDASYHFYKKHTEVEREQIFESAAREFYAQSVEHDRDLFIEYIKKVITADQKITKKENEYVNRLFKLWGLK